MTYRVVIFSDLPLKRELQPSANDYTFGPFEKKETAEQCLIALASRSDITSAKIEEVV